MINLSMAQALSIWTDLEAAYHGRHEFGGDTAEIYIYRLMSCSPAADRPVVTEGGLAAEARAARIAAAKA